MLIPHDPNIRVGLWEALERSIDRNALVAVVSDGQDMRIPQKYEGGADPDLFTVRHMRKLNYVRIGTERSLPLPPHFGVAFTDESSTDVLEEYLARDVQPRTTLDDVTLLIDLIFFEVKSLKKLIIPLNVRGVPLSGLISNMTALLDALKFRSFPSRFLDIAAAVSSAVKGSTENS